MLPPWVPDLEPSPPPPDEPPKEEDRQRDRDRPAPQRRWADTRRELGRFAKSGDSRALRRGLRHYTVTGLGGAASASARFAATAQVAQDLADSLTNRDGALQEVLRTANDATAIVTAVIEAVSPTDGTLDAEARQTAISDALADVLTDYPSADLTNLSPEQVNALVEIYVAHDVCNQIDLQVGESIRRNAPDLTTAVARLSRLHEYVRQTIFEAFRTARINSAEISEGRIRTITQSAIAEAFRVFEEDLR